MKALKDFDQHNDVIEIKDRIPECLQGKRIFCANDLFQSVWNALGVAKLTSFYDSGVYCRVMTADKAGWQEGRIVMRLEFVPNEAAQLSDELDELRNKIG
jgi:hypothetical protein